MTGPALLPMLHLDILAMDGCKCHCTSQVKCSHEYSGYLSLNLKSSKLQQLTHGHLTPYFVCDVSIGDSFKPKIITLNFLSELELAREVKDDELYYTKGNKGYL